jgi:hypothetical protein
MIVTAMNPCFVISLRQHLKSHVHKSAVANSSTANRFIDLHRIRFFCGWRKRTNSYCRWFEHGKKNFR